MVLIRAPAMITASTVAAIRVVVSAKGMPMACCVSALAQAGVPCGRSPAGAPRCSGGAGQVRQDAEDERGEQGGSEQGQ